MPFMATFGAGSTRGFGAVSQLQLAPASPPADPNSVVYSTAGTYTWVCPAGVYKVSVVCIGAGIWGVTSRGGGGGGGGLIYMNNIPVSPGSSYTVVVASNLTSPTSSSFSWGGNSITANRGGNTAGGTTAKSGSGASPAVGYSGGSGLSGGGGAAGYAGSGGAGGSTSLNNPGSTGSGGGGGGGASGDSSPSGAYISAGGGGVGLYPTSLTNGSGGGIYYSTIPLPIGGGGGSGGGQGGYGGQGSGFTTDYTGSMLMGQGGNYGGGGGTAPGTPGQGGLGAVRIMWPGDTRQFPTTSAGTP
jgi:hypothetical protein